MNRTLKEEQLLAINHDEGNILVSASAGSGKTMVMIERILRLISEGKAEMSQIFASTFTEAAARDMKDKLRESLAERAAKGDRLSEKALADCQTADVCTIHSFCAKLLRIYFFAAGVSPDFKIIDETEAAALKKQCLDEVFKKLFDEKNPDFLLLCKRHLKRRGTDELKKLILSVYEVSREETDPDAFLNLFETTLSPDAFPGAIKEYSDMLGEKIDGFYSVLTEAEKEFSSSGVEKGKEFCENFRKGLSTVYKKDVYSFNDLKDYSLRNTNFGGAAITQNLKDLKAKVQSANSEFKAMISEVSEHISLKSSDEKACASIYLHAKSIVAIVKAFAESYETAKKEENSLDFGDLQRYTLVALGFPDVLNELKEKYKYAFVDEYQDVNPLQEKILSLLTDGKLFMVGDVKQSIYGFRGCRPEYFIQKRNAYKTDGGNVVDLNFNFRSSEKVINAVNEIFDYCYTEKIGGIDYKKQARLSFGGVYPENAKGNAVLHVLSKEKKEKVTESPRIYDLIKEAKAVEEKEISPISSLVARIIIDETNSSFYDAKEKTFKPVQFKDVAILSRSKDTEYVKNLVDGLYRRGIPVESEVSVNVCEFPEIQTLIWFLKLIDCFLDDFALINTMLSPLFGFTEEELFSAASYCEDERQKPRNFCDVFLYCLNNENSPTYAKFSEFKKKTDEYRILADFKGAKGILYDVIDKSGYENFLLCEDDGDQKLKRLYKFLAETESGGKTLTVSEFLKKTENSAESFKLSPGGNEDSVKILTMHSSKGLEFPVVIICGLEKPFYKKDETPPVIIDRDQGLLPEFYDDAEKTFSETPLRGLLKLKMRKKRTTEEMRLFYVATTRAKYSLHLTFEGTLKDRDETFSQAERFSDFIPNGFATEYHSPEDLILTEFKRQKRKVILAEEEKEKTEEMKKRFATVYPFKQETLIPLKNSVTAALKESYPDYYPTHTVFKDDSTDKEKGIAAHKILQFYDFLRLDSFDEQIREMLSSGTLSEEDLGLVNSERLKAALRGGAFDELKNKTCYREQEFTVNVPAKMVFPTDSEEPVLLQGVIDLLAIDQNGAEIIDYKYSSLAANELKEKYKKQLFLYSYAVEKALNIKVNKTSLFNIFTGETVTVYSGK